MDPACHPSPTLEPGRADEDPVCLPVRLYGADVQVETERGEAACRDV